MYYDLNVPFGPVTEGSTKGSSSKAPSKPEYVLSEKEQKALDARLDLLVHLGYTVVALNQTIRGAFNPTTHQNTLMSVKPRKDILVLRRLTIILNEDSEKGFGLTNNNTDALKAYDIIALSPTTPASFTLACLTHTVPSPIAAHIISLDLQTNQGLPFLRKLSTVKTAIKNGAVLEICYSPAVKRTTGDRNRRNWWVNAKEVVRTTGGKGLIFSSKALEADVRGPKDIINLATILGCKQDLAHHAMTTTPKSLILRAQTRQTYRAVLSEPRLVLPTQQVEAPTTVQAPLQEGAGPSTTTEVAHEVSDVAPPPKRPLEAPGSPTKEPVNKKRKRDKKKGNA